MKLLLGTCTFFKRSILHNKKVRVPNFLFFVMTCVLSSPVESSEAEWRLGLDKKGIQVYQRKMADLNLKEVKASTLIEANLEDVIDIFEDDRLYEVWCHRCREISLVESLNPNEKIIYYEVNVPWPFKNRDSYTHQNKVFDEHQKRVSYILTNYSEKYPHIKGKVRVEKFKGLWRFQELSGGKVELYYQQYVDIGGMVPQWVVNQFAVDVPYHTLRKLRQLLLSHK